jgi:hypothetical protein
MMLDLSLFPHFPFFWLASCPDAVQLPAAQLCRFFVLPRDILRIDYAPNQEGSVLDISWNIQESQASRVLSGIGTCRLVLEWEGLLGPEAVRQ